MKVRVRKNGVMGRRREEGMEEEEEEERGREGEVGKLGLR